MNRFAGNRNGSLSRLLLNRGPLSLGMQRMALEYVLGSTAIPRSLTIDSTRIGRMKASWIIPSGSLGQRVILYLHGGGFAVGSRRSHLPFLARLCLATGANGLLIDYRLAPRHPFPAALHDAVHAYRWLQDNHVDPSGIVLAGDGSGAGLALSCMLSLRADAQSLPAAALLISPWVDLENSDKTLQLKDQGFSKNWQGIRMDYYADMYVGELDPGDPLITPINADLSGLPPMLIQSGRDEVLAEDALKLVGRAKSCGIDVHLEQHAGSRHSLPLFAGREPEADRLLKHAARFLSSRMGYLDEYSA